MQDDQTVIPYHTHALSGMVLICAALDVVHSILPAALFSFLRVCGCQRLASLLTLAHLTLFCNAGRLASLATQLGVTQATPPLYDLSRGITGMSSSLGGEVRLPSGGAAVISGSRALPVSSVYAARPQNACEAEPPTEMYTSGSPIGKTFSRNCVNVLTH
eukprot:scaffold11388_cov18-Tisochrysis_lutea.AAC.3